MLRDMDFDLRRREMVGGSLVLGLLALAGCQRQKQAWTPLSESELTGPPPAPHPLAARPRPEQQARMAPTGPSGVISRREWTNAQPNLSLINPMNGLNRITVHHDGMAPVTLRNKNDVAGRIEQIRRAHVNHQPDPWADIGYHYIIDPQGRVWEGRPVRFQGAHVKDQNENNLGVLVLGNFEVQRP